MRTIEIRYELSRREYDNWCSRHDEELFNIVMLTEVIEKLDGIDFITGDDINSIDGYGEAWRYETDRSVEDIQEDLEKCIEASLLGDIDFRVLEVTEYIEE